MCCVLWLNLFLYNGLEMYVFMSNLTDYLSYRGILMSGSENNGLVRKKIIYASYIGLEKWVSVYNLNKYL